MTSVATALPTIERRPRLDYFNVPFVVRRSVGKDEFSLEAEPVLPFSLYWLTYLKLAVLKANQAFETFTLHASR